MGPARAERPNPRALLPLLRDALRLSRVHLRLLLRGLVLRLRRLWRLLRARLGRCLLVGGRLLRGLLRCGLRRGLGRGGPRGRRAHTRSGAHTRGTGEVQPGPVGRVAEVDRGAGPDVGVLDPPALHESAVGAAQVLQQPAAFTAADRGVPPGHPRIVEDEVALRVAAEAVGPGWVQRPGLSVEFEYEFRHPMPHLLSPEVPHGGAV